MAREKKSPAATDTHVPRLVGTVDCPDVFNPQATTKPSLFHPREAPTRDRRQRKFVGNIPSFFAPNTFQIQQHARWRDRIDLNRCNPKQLQIPRFAAPVKNWLRPRFACKFQARFWSRFQSSPCSPLELHIDRKCCIPTRPRFHFA